MMEEKPGVKYLSDVTPDCESEFIEKFPGRYLFKPKKAGAQTAEANLNAGVAAAEQIVDFFETGNTACQVNK
jgi:D-3-phosphoglycerate dehydrogenase